MAENDYQSRHPKSQASNFFEAGESKIKWLAGRVADTATKTTS